MEHVEGERHPGLVAVHDIRRGPTTLAFGQGLRLGRGGQGYEECREEEGPDRPSEGGVGHCFSYE